MNPVIPVTSNTNPSIGGKINPPNIIESINTVVATGKPGVFLAIQLEEFGNKGPRNKPQIAKKIPNFDSNTSANPNGIKVERMQSKIILSGSITFAKKTPKNRPIEKKK